MTSQMLVPCLCMVNSQHCGLCGTNWMLILAQTAYISVCNITVGRFICQATAKQCYRLLWASSCIPLPVVNLEIFIIMEKYFKMFMVGRTPFYKWLGCSRPLKFVLFFYCITLIFYMMVSPLWCTLNKHRREKFLKVPRCYFCSWNSLMGMMVSPLIWQGQGKILIYVRGECFFDCEIFWWGLLFV
jgi:hypothetical protein